MVRVSLQSRIAATLAKKAKTSSYGEKSLRADDRTPKCGYQQKNYISTGSMQPLRVVMLQRTLAWQNHRGGTAGRYR